MPSGGAVDSMTLAIAHRDRAGRAVLDCLRELRPPFSPEAVVGEFAAVLKSYRVSTVTGDRYAGEWPREQCRKHGIEYRVSERTKSDVYREALPLLNSGRVELLDLPRLRAQLLGLERRVARGGKDSVDHGPGGHDDVANAACGVLVLAGPAAQEVMLYDLHDRTFRTARKPAEARRAAELGLSLGDPFLAGDPVRRSD
jgi:hypothetical protein